MILPSLGRALTSLRDSDEKIFVEERSHHISLSLGVREKSGNLDGETEISFADP
jgi:hypothetical protein